MRKLGNKGFTLVEVIAVVVILATLMAIMVPTVNHLIKMNAESNYEDLEKTLTTMAKGYLTDYRYEVVVDGVCSSEEVTNKGTKKISSVQGQGLPDSHLPVSWLVEQGYVTVNEEGNIINPLDKSQKLKLYKNGEEDTKVSYVLVQYNCSNKTFSYTLEEDSLVWVDLETGE